MWGAAPRTVFSTLLAALIVATFALLLPAQASSRVDATSAVAATPSFADVPESNPFFAEVEQLFARGITNGCGVNSSGQRIFCPLQNVPRQAFATFLNRAKGLGLMLPTTPTFADVPASHSFYGQIERFFEEDITDGCGVNSSGRRIFCPLQNVNRQATAAFLVRAAELPLLTPATPTFADVPTTHPFYGHIERAVANGIITACGTNSRGQLLYCPLGQITRQEMARVLIRGFPTAAVDASAPTVPAGLSLASRTQTSITLAWAASLDNFAVAGYGVYRNTSNVGNPIVSGFTVTGLACGTSYTLAVDAVDEAGNRSAQSSLTASTSACSVDTQPPSVPQGQVISAATQTSFVMSWNASTDNVGVAGYRVYLNGTLAGTTTGLSHTYGGLQCGTTYTVALEAFDSAGNSSNRAMAEGPATTSSCSGSPPPPPPPPPPGTSGAANLWVDTNGGSCSRSASQAGYADAAACGSFDAAYDAAACGDVIRVKGGTYSRQAVTGQRSCGGGWDQVTCDLCVEFFEAVGERVIVADLDGNADWVEFNDLESQQDWSVTASNVDHVICRNCDVRSVFYSGTPISHISMIGGDVGPQVNGHPQLAPSAGNGAGWMTDVLFQGVNFHDVTTTNAASYHVECMQVAGGTRVTFRANRWSNCGIFDLSLTEYNNSGPPTDFVVENNFFGPSINGGSYSFHVNSNASAIVRLVLQYNSSPQPFLVKNVVRHQNSIVRGNLAPRPACDAPGTISYSNNVWTGGTCGSTDFATTSLGFVNSAGLDFHLLDGAAALNRGGTSCPSRDFDGDSRSAPCDAGADER